jgi:hypothetical protein
MQRYSGEMREADDKRLAKSGRKRLMRCPQCTEWFDGRQLDAVFYVLSPPE